MNFRKPLILLILSFCYFFLAQAQSEKEKTIIYKFRIDQEISPVAARITNKAFEEAQKIQADYILIQMNTYGGMLDAADSIRTKIINSKIPVLVFIDNNAASAGALISIACDSIYMREGASIGAATVVDGSGNVLPDKYQAYMRSMMRATAETHGHDTIINNTDTIIRWKRDPLIAEAMVDPRTYIPGINDSGKVLTFTTEEAIKNRYCEGKAENIQEVLKVAGIENYEITEYITNTLDSIINFLLNPFVHGILIMIIVGGIYFELQTPGVGFPSIAAITAAILYFAPLYLEGLAENWEILIFILGLILLAVEIFAIPGFGITGIAGIILIITGLTLSLVGNIVFEFDGYGLKILSKAFFIVTVSFFLSLVVSIFLGKKLLTSHKFSFLVLNTSQQKQEGYVGVENSLSLLIGKEATAFSMLRPAGKIEIGNEIFDAKAEFGFIDKGESVVITRFESGQLYVVKKS